MAWIILSIPISLSFCYHYVENHETIHKQVCRNFGGQTYHTINITFTTLQGYTTCSNITAGNSKEYAMSQSFVEAIGYPLGEIMNLMLFIFYGTGLLMILLSNDYEENVEPEIPDSNIIT
jgi:hypothetical protein